MHRVLVRHGLNRLDHELARTLRNGVVLFIGAAVAIGVREEPATSPTASRCRQLSITAD
jgi:hypothetical protein